MIETRTVQYDRKEIVALICDKCGKRVEPHDARMEFQEFHRFEEEGGYGSRFGDCCPYTLDLCDECWHGMVGDLVKYMADESEPEKQEGEGMTTEQRTITVTAYRDAEGRPTCALSYAFVACRFMGRDETSQYAACNITRDVLTVGDGYLRPCAGCPAWGEEVPK